MMKLSCKDLKSDSDCHFEATRETASEVIGIMMTHAKTEHADDVAKMAMSDEEMQAMLESKVHM